MSRTTLTETQLASLTVAWSDLAMVAGDATSTATTTTGTVSTTASTVGATSGTGFANGDYVQIDAEIMLITAGGGTGTFTITRAQFGTLATAHASGAAIVSLSVGNRVVPSNDGDVVLAFNTDAVNPHTITLRGAYGSIAKTIPPASANGLGFVMTPKIARTAWGIPADSGAFWINVSDASVFLVVVSVP